MTLLIVEPFYGGSHKHLVDVLCRHYTGTCSSRGLKHALFTLPAKKWHWRARTSALTFAQTIPHDVSYKVLFCSSVLNVAELVALRPDLQTLKKIIYFHENQLVYPVRKQQQRDFQFGYNQILSCLVADIVLFNSRFNLDSFLDNVESFLHMMPDCRPQGVRDKLVVKCHVLYFPVQFVDVPRLGRQFTGCTVTECGSGDGRQPSEVCSCNTDNLVHTVSIVSDNIDTTADIRADIADTRADIADTCADVAVSRDDVADNDADVTDIKADIAKTVADDADIRADIADTRADIADTSADMNGTVSLPANIQGDSDSLHIVWPHRWEHDKNPEAFFSVLYALHNAGLNFKLSVLGQTFTDVPSVFAEARERLSSHIVNYGYVDSRAHYHHILSTADVAVSTALHEFFGVAMVEAVYAGCYPLCPQRLVYPEIFPDECLYNTDRQLLKRLRTFCRNPAALRARNFKMDLTRFSWNHLSSEYEWYIERT